MISDRKCPECGSPVSGVHTGGLCPTCLFGLALDEPEEPDLVGRTVSHYRIEELLGAGGMGVVYRAQDTRLGRDVALKFINEALSLDPSAQVRFEREARSISCLNHPAICTVFDFGEYEGRPFIVMELIEGRSLHEILRAGPMPQEELLSIGLQITDGVKAAHSQGILHRDIKSGNVVVNSNGEAKILDFGLAKPIGPASDSASRLMTAGESMLVGTLPYMAPEQFDDRPYDQRSDIFSLGVVFYEMATGKSPFSRGSVASTIKAVLEDQPEPVKRFNDSITSDLQKIILKMLSKDPKDRYPDVGEVKRNLERVFDSSPVLSPLQVWWTKVIALLTVLVLALSLVFLLDHLVFDARNIEAVAVLPFEDYSLEADQEYLAEAITDALINRLAQIGNIRVPSRTSVLRYEGSNRSPRQLARELRVDAVVTGTVQRRGDEVVIEVQLLAADSGIVEFSGDFAGEFSDLMTLQTQVVNSIAEEVRQISGDPGESLEIAQSLPSDAYESFLRGVYLLNRRENTERAVEFFQEAIERKPDYAAAHANLAHAYLMLEAYGNRPPREVMPSARDAAQRALELDPNSKEALAALAVVKMGFEWDFEGSRILFDQTLRAAPNYATGLHWYGLYEAAVGNMVYAAELITRAKGLEPHSPVIITALGRIHYYRREFDLAHELFREAFELEEGFSPAHLGSGLAYLGQEKHLEALAQFRKGLPLNPEWRPLFEALEFGVKGDEEGLSEALDKIRTLRTRAYLSPFYLAVLHSTLGRKDDAFQWLRRAVEDRSEYLAFLAVDPVFDSLREDERFDHLLLEVGLASN